MKRTTYTEEQRQEMKDLYLSGLSIVQIATKMGWDRGTINRELRTMLTLRTVNESRRVSMGVLSVKSDAFDVLTDDALYWIGFLYADGHIDKSCSLITLTLSEKDKEHLEKLNQFLGGYLKLRDVTPKKMKGAPGQINFDGKYWRIGVTDECLYIRLKELGFTHNKTLAIIPHDMLKNSRHFWRGVVDGDGWVCWTNDKRKNYPSLGLSGTEDTLIGFLQFLERAGLECMATPKKRKGNVWELNLNAGSGKKAADILYTGATTYLDRKYQKYQEFISENLEDTQ